MAPKKKSSEAVLEPEKGLCFFLNPNDHSWVVGDVKEWDPKKGATCVARKGSDPRWQWENGEQVSGLPADDVLNIKEEILDENVEDLLDLTVLHDSTILNVLRKRYMGDYIYTNIGAITVALNPFNFKIPRYMDTEMPKYLAEGDRIEQNIPHSWAVAHNTYYEMRNAVREPFNQCILVSGESGAGKTEASKIVMKYLACLSCLEGSDDQKRAGLEVGRKINITSPPLEAFGNAKTSRNDNSSRFGKWMQVKFDSAGFLVGADITKYLLEKSRIVTALKGERIYHSFYILCRDKDRAKYNVTSDKDYVSTSAGGVSENKDFDTQEEFDEVNDSFVKLGIDDGAIDAVWRTVAGILISETMTFEPDGEYSKVGKGGDKMQGQIVSNWRIDGGTFAKELITKTMTMKEGGQEKKVVKNLTVSEAMDGRSALSKSLYDSQFQWLIDTCNKMLDNSSGEGRWVGLLDIFGFEKFDVNSFEQLCINLANESLQCHYNQYIFQKDMDDCRAEGINVDSVEFPDNTPCLNMIAGKGGIFAMLDEECALGQGTDLSFLDKVVGACEKHKQFFEKQRLAKTSFIVHHYAGSVSYEVAGFLDKNRDTLKPEAKLMMRASSDPHIAALLPEPNEDQKKSTVAGFFKQQVSALMEKINSTNPHWIRCIKPHPAKKPLHVHGISCMAQLESSGVLGTVKIRKAGFPVRIPFDAFYQQYRILGVGAGMDPSDLPGCAAKILQAAEIKTEFGQVGKTKVFLKSDSYVHLEKERKKALSVYGEIVQAWCRGYMASLSVKERVHEQNGEVISKLRAQIQEELKVKREAERAERAARAEAEKEERERQEREERELRERIAADLDALLEAQRIDYEGIVADELRLWQKMMADLAENSQRIERETKEREERRIREERERKEAEERRIRNAVTDMQRVVRGHIERERLLRDLVEMRRAQTEFDIDAAVFRQHQRMLALDRRRLDIERTYLQQQRARAAAAHRDSIFKAAESRRARHRQEVEERKTARGRADVIAAEEITEAAVEEALRLREARRREAERAVAERHAENVARRQRQERLSAAAFEYRQRRSQETEQYILRRREHEEEVRRVFSGQAERRQEMRQQRSDDLTSFARGQTAWQEREDWEMARAADAADTFNRSQAASLRRSFSPSPRPRTRTRSNPPASQKADRILSLVGAGGDPSDVMGSPGYVPYLVDRFTPMSPPVL